MKPIRDLTPEEALQESTSYRLTYVAHMAGIGACMAAIFIRSFFIEFQVHEALFMAGACYFLGRALGDLSSASDDYLSALDHVSGLEQILQRQSGYDE